MKALIKRCHHCGGCGFAIYKGLFPTLFTEDCFQCGGSGKVTWKIEDSRVETKHKSIEKCLKRAI